MRLPRIFGKKRGHRRTGSQAWGSVGEAVFHAALVGAGLVFAALLISGVAVPEWRINHNFVETRCTVLGHGLVRRSVEDPPGVVQATWRPTLRVRYEADGESREAWTTSRPGSGQADRDAALERLKSWQIGAEVPGWFDPAHPGTVVLERGYNWWMWLLALLLPSALLAFGGAGLVRSIRRFGRSEEAIAAAAGLPDLLVPASRAARATLDAPDHPGIPRCDDLVNSPGTVLRYRLPIESPENWNLLGVGLFALFWNAVLVVLAVGAGLEIRGGRVDWLLLALLGPFLAVGATGIVLFVRGLVLATAVGTTQLEIAAHPLRPGGRYDVLLAQGGAGTLRQLSLALELEEHATYRQGTDARSERVVVWRQVFETWRDVELSPGARFEVRAAIAIPSEAMHSFDSEHNAVRWRVVVHGVPERWPPFRRIFPVVVFPREASA